MIKRKFRTAASARSERQLAADWEDLQRRWEDLPVLSRTNTTQVKKGKSKQRPYYSPISPAESVRHTGNKEVRSLGSWVTGTHSTKPSEVYTGTAIVGICTMHKSNLVPVFSADDAEAIAKMRR